MGGIINRPIKGWDSRVKMKKLASELLKKNISVVNEISDDNDKELSSNKDKLVCFYVTARSLVYKMSELDFYVYEERK